MTYDETYKKTENLFDKGNYRTFLGPNEIVELFKDYNSIYHWEGLGSGHRHGKGPIEQHDMIEFIIEKDRCDVY